MGGSAAIPINPVDRRQVFVIRLHILRRHTMGIASLHPSYIITQQPLPRHMIEFEPDAIGILEQDRSRVSRRPLILAWSTNDFCAERDEEAVQFVDVGALAGTETR